jgi:23S rRNA pseudouridine1911/1915/1917 synthase
MVEDPNQAALIEGAELLEVIVPALMDAMRVDRALATITGMSRAEVARVIDSGAVMVDGSVVSKVSTPLVEGARLEAILPPMDDGTVAPDDRVLVRVLYEDDDVVVVDKSAEQVVHPGAGNKESTLVSGLLARYPDIADLVEQGYSEANRPGIVHRLDKGTSGVLMVARTPRAMESLSEQLADRSATRRYVGIVEGHLESDRGVIDAPLGRSATIPTKMAVRSDGREARTGYEVLTRLAKPQRSVVGLSLETGRTHQIRVHMAAISTPIVNDSRYGKKPERSLDALRLALHAGRLEFNHPSDGRRIKVVSPWPSDLKALGGAEEAQAFLDREG